ncbi:MAG: signal peptidase I [Bacteroidetes bacterium]|nr:signal peptidase I [Bacteroidota bacterium]
MTDGQIFIITFSILFLIRQCGLYKMFEAAGVAGWKAFVPVLYTVEWLKLAGKKQWWIVLSFIPGINVLMSVLLCVDLVRCYGKYTVGENAMAALLPFIYFPYIGFMEKDLKFIGPAASKNHPRSKTREWIDAIAFAIIAATVIRSFFIEAYTIPTPSMEETLMVNDFLFVSKMNFGARVPMTPVAFPLTHNTLPFTTGTKSYLDWPSLPYFRIPGWEKITNNDIVVFNWPADSLNDRPIDKKDNYIKRCVAIAGDSLKIIDGKVYINGKLNFIPPKHQRAYRVFTDGTYISKEMRRDLKISDDDIRDYGSDGNNSAYLIMLLTEHAYVELKKQSFVKKIDVFVMPKGEFEPDIYHHYEKLNWNLDNFGSLYIPKKGVSIPMNVNNYYLYQTAIRKYENNLSLILNGTTVYMDGKPITSYTFKMNYYWMMGDNRHNSLDSRMWGFVPEDHIVGKPVLIWFSYNSDAPWYKKIRFERMFRFIN